METSIDFSIWIFCSFDSDSNRATVETVIKEVLAQFHGVDKTPWSRLVIEGTVCSTSFPRTLSLN